MTLLKIIYQINCWPFNKFLIALESPNYWVNSFILFGCSQLTRIYRALILCRVFGAQCERKEMRGCPSLQDPAEALPVEHLVPISLWLCPARSPPISIVRDMWFFWQLFPSSLHGSLTSVLFTSIPLGKNLKDTISLPKRR